MNSFQDHMRRRASVSQDPSSAASNVPTHLRPLPSYSVPPSALATPASGPAPPSQTPAPTTTRYQNRERLYYEPFGDKNASQSVQTTKPQSVVARLADEAPPAISLYDVGSLTPERKHAHDAKPEGEKKPFEAMLVDDLAASVPTMQPSEGNWVTVFGFAGAQSSAVLNYFKKLGVVEESEMGQGNWMHLKYSTLWAAQKALAKNGTVMSGLCMLGVIPTNRAMEQVSQAAESFMSPIKKESIKKNTTADDQDIFIRSSLFSPAVRSTTDKAPATTEPSSHPHPHPHPHSHHHHHPEAKVPLPPESAVTRALGYVFGW